MIAFAPEDGARGRAAQLLIQTILTIRGRRNLHVRKNHPCDTAMKDVDPHLAEVFAPVARDLGAVGLKAKLRMESGVASCRPRLSRTHRRREP